MAGTNSDTLRADVNRLLALIEQDAPYELLSIPETADEAAIKNAFRALARVYHGDNYPPGTLDESLSRDMLRVMAGLSRAQITLLNPNTRNEVNAKIALQQRGVPTDVRVIFAADEAFRTGKRLLERNAWADGREKLREAVQMNPAEAEFQIYLLWADYCLLAERGGPLAEQEMVKISRRLEDLAKTVPRNDAAWTFVGNIARNRGDDHEAQQCYQAALKSNGDNIEAQSNLRLLAKRASSRKSEDTNFFTRLFRRK